jgi:hypothetical protein
MNRHFNVTIGGAPPIDTSTTETPMKTDDTRQDRASSANDADIPTGDARAHAIGSTPPPAGTANTQQKLTTPEKPAEIKKPGTPKPLAQYSTYAKYASTIVRQLLFSDSRFNNSKLVTESMLKPLQVKNGFVPPNTRLGTLGMTRLNSATANFSKAFSYITSAIEKQRAGKNADDDIVSATALMGEGLTETFAGIGADYGNYLVKQWQTQLGATSSTIGTPSRPSSSPSPSTAPSDVVSEAGTGAPIPASAVESDADAALVHLPPMSPEQHDALMAQSAKTYNDQLDAQVAAIRERAIQGIVSGLEATPPANQPARLQALAAQAQQRLETATQLASEAKRAMAAQKAQSTGDFIQLDKEMKEVRDQLKFGKYTDPGVAGLSHEDAAKRLGATLLGYRRREEQTAQAFELLTEDAPLNLAEMTQQLEAARRIGNTGELTKEEKLAKLDKLKTAYRERFLEYQNAISKPSANFREVLKISPALKAQLGPAALNTAFGTLDFGARIDDYVKKVSNGTDTEADRLRLAGSTMGLIGGMASFIPIVGPIVSIGFALAGIGLGQTADSLAGEAARAQANELRDAAVDVFRKTHPGTENDVYKSDIGAGA